jgi:hypothetical protein
MSPRRMRLAVGGIAAASTLFWMLTGMGWWAPVLDPMSSFSEYLRGFVIFAAHVAGAGVGLFEIIEGKPEGGAS